MLRRASTDAAMSSAGSGSGTLILLYVFLIAFLCVVLICALRNPKRLLYIFGFTLIFLSVFVFVILSSYGLSRSSNQELMYDGDSPMWCQDHTHYYSRDNRLESKEIVNPEYKVKKKVGIKIAYILMVHSMDSVLAARPLLRAIWRKDFFYVIMVDKYTPGAAKRVLHDYIKSGQFTIPLSAKRTVSTNKPSNVRLMLAKVQAWWGGIGLVQNELDALQELLAMGEWDYAINLSGDTFPLVTQNRIVEQLEYWKGRNFVTTNGYVPDPVEAMPRHKADRVRHVKFPTGIAKVYFGSQWFILTREFVKFTLFSPLSRNLLLAYAHAQAEIPDEMFFQTLIQNSVFNRTTIRTWEKGPETHLGKSLNPVCRYEKWWDCKHKKPGFPREYPCFFGWKDYGDLIHSHCIFARKLDVQISEDLYVSLQDHLLQMEADEKSMEQFEDADHEDNTLASNSTVEVQWDQNVVDEDENILDDDEETGKKDDEEPPQKTSKEEDE